MLIVKNSGLPSEMDEDELEDDVLEANNMAALQHANGYRPRPSALSFYPDPAGSGWPHQCSRPQRSEGKISSVVRL